MFQKKGQITFFIILGIVLVVSFALIFYLFQNSTDKGESEIQQIQSFELSTSPINSYVESCIESVGEDAILWIGNHGGYFEVPTYNPDDYQGTAYYFYVDRNIMPSKEKIEQELSKYMDSELFFCIRNFIAFEEMGFEIEQGKINTTTMIRPNNVLFNVNFPIKISREQNTKQLVSFQGSINNVRLSTIYDVSKSIIYEQMNDYNSVCLSCIIDGGIENDLHIDISRGDNSSLLFTITDYNTIINDMPYEYRFANKYEEFSCSNLPLDDSNNEYLLGCIQQKIMDTGYTFYVEDITNLTAYVNQSFSYKINAVGLNLSFADYTPLFDINKKTGEIQFTPAQEQTGNHSIWIFVKDTMNEKYESFTLEIKNEAE
jgi:hypothetical protein|tara:strand:+ start:140 stop:1258 length:1119 start_codon:yes stop_codon:yes gene_type:complete